MSEVTDWTEEEALEHLRQTFDRACFAHPDLMEPYMVRLESAPELEHKEIMRSGLRETIKQRYPATPNHQGAAA